MKARYVYAIIQFQGLIYLISFIFIISMFGSEMYFGAVILAAAMYFGAKLGHLEDQLYFCEVYNRAYRIKQIQKAQKEI